MKVNDTPRKTGFWWIFAIIMIVWAIISGHPPKNTTPHDPVNVHTIPTPHASTHANR